jgi:hypothetical protein
MTVAGPGLLPPANDQLGGEQPALSSHAGLKSCPAIRLDRRLELRQDLDSRSVVADGIRTVRAASDPIAGKRFGEVLELDPGSGKPKPEVIVLRRRERRVEASVSDEELARSDRREQCDLVSGQHRVERIRSNRHGAQIVIPPGPDLAIFEHHVRVGVKDDPGAHGRMLSLELVPAPEVVGVQEGEVAAGRGAEAGVARGSGSCVFLVRVQARHRRRSSRRRRRSPRGLRTSGREPTRVQQERMLPSDTAVRSRLRLARAGGCYASLRSAAAGRFLRFRLDSCLGGKRLLTPLGDGDDDPL